MLPPSAPELIPVVNLWARMLSLLSQPCGFAPGAAPALAKGVSAPSVVMSTFDAEGKIRTSSGADPSLAYTSGMRESYAPRDMGKEYVNQARRPLSEYVGASVEFCAYPGAPDAPVPWDPMRFSELYKVSGNNPDVAWLREAELKHGRLSMMAIVGVFMQSAGVHLPGVPENSDWSSAPTTCGGWLATSVLVIIGLIEGQTSVGLYDLYNGQTDKREPGDIGFGTQFLSKDKVAADRMRLKELKNGRLAMIGIMGIAFNHVVPGSFPFSVYN